MLTMSIVMFVLAILNGGFAFWHIYQGDYARAALSASVQTGNVLMAVALLQSAWNKLLLDAIWRQSAPDLRCRDNMGI